ncbi:MAG: hypothetical protein ACXABY_03400 [Candidatus Thorarchaeota archaeon]
MQWLVATAGHVGKVRKPLAIICVGIVLLAVWRAVVEPAMGAWYFQVLVIHGLGVVFLGLAVDIYSTLLIGGHGRYEPI